MEYLTLWENAKDYKHFLNRFIMGKIYKIFAWSVIALGAVAGMTGLIDLSNVVEFLFGGSAFMAFAAGVTVGEIKDGTATVENAKELDETYLKDDLEKKLIMIGPNENVIDTLTRSIGNTRKVSSVTTGGWEISVRDVEDTVVAGGTVAAGGTLNITVSKPLIWKRNDTLCIKDSDSEAKHNFFVEEVNDSVLKCRLIYDTNIPADLPTIAEDASIIRLSSAKSELDAQTDVLYQTPNSRTNYCQIHMAQIEESVIHSIHSKEVTFDFSTLKEQTLFQFRRDMELTNLFGKKGYFISNGKPTHTSDGLWEQIEKEYVVKGVDFNNAKWVDMTRHIFDGNNGSDRRIALVGAGLMAQWSTAESFQKQLDAAQVEVVYGIRFNRIVTNFGELLVKSLSGTMVGDYTGKGIVIDPAYIRKDVFEALNTTPLDLDTTGQRRVKAVRLLENYCLYVENQPVHCKLV